MKTTILYIMMLILLCTGRIFAEVEAFELSGVVKLNWTRLNNGFDKTTTRILDNGIKLYDDLDEYAFSFIGLQFNLFIMDNIKLALRLGKKDTLWASHNNYFNSEHTQPVNDFLGETSEALDKPNFFGVKVDRLYLSAEKIMGKYVNFIGGRQLYSGTVYEEADSIQDIPQDLFVYFVGDGLVFQLNNWGFLLKKHKMQTDIFVFKLNDNSAELYGTHGGLLWERKYGDYDVNLYGLINRLTIKEHFIKNYILVYDKGGRELISGDDNQDGYDNRYILGLSYTYPNVLLKKLKVLAEAGYCLGEKALGTIYELDEDLGWCEKEYYDQADYQAYIYRVGLEYQVGKLTAAVFNVGGSGDDPATPDKIEGFYGFNEAFHTRVYGMENDYSGYGEIYKANPYQHNFSQGEPPVEGDQRFVDPSLCSVPAGTIGFKLSYNLLKQADENNKLIPCVECFYYYVLPGYTMTALNTDNKKVKINELGMEFDISLKYIYLNAFSVKLIYGLYLPGEAYASGYNRIIEDEIGRDPAELIKVQAEVFF